jgi:hypothetical protein
VNDFNTAEREAMLSDGSKSTHGAVKIITEQRFKQLTKTPLGFIISTMHDGVVPVHPGEGARHAGNEQNAQDFGG